MNKIPFANAAHPKMMIAMVNGVPSKSSPTKTEQTAPQAI